MNQSAIYNNNSPDREEWPFCALQNQENNTKSPLSHKILRMICTTLTFFVDVISETHYNNATGYLMVSYAQYVQPLQR